ncbi:hypothetical protein VPHD479_0124 [Vibrio phage D479]
MWIFSGITAFLSVFILKFAVFKREITWYELIGGGLVASVLAIGIHLGLQAGYMNSQTADTELWHGFVQEKNKVTETCPSGWTDWPDAFCSNYDTRTVEYNCRTETSGTGKNKTSRRVCDYKTQYNYDYRDETRWFVKTTIGGYEIDRVDRRGTDMPIRWGVIHKEDPVSKSNGYTNWLLAPNNAFEYARSENALAPKYPRVIDYYNVDLVIDDTEIANPKNEWKSPLDGWNEQVRNWLRVNGYEKQVNVIVIGTKKPASYFDDVMYQWKGGKKNDVILFFGLDDDNKLNWFKSTSFAKGYNNQLLHSELASLHESNKDKPDFWQTALDKSLTVIEADYNRYEMKNMEYIKKSIQPPTGLLVIIQILAFLAGAGISYGLAQNTHRE